MHTVENLQVCGRMLRSRSALEHTAASSDRMKSVWLHGHSSHFPRANITLSISIPPPVHCHPSENESMYIPPSTSAKRNFKHTLRSLQCNISSFTDYLILTKFYLQYIDIKNGKLYFLSISRSFWGTSMSHVFLITVLCYSSYKRQFPHFLLKLIMHLVMKINLKTSLQSKH